MDVARPGAKSRRASLALATCGLASPTSTTSTVSTTSRFNATAAPAAGAGESGRRLSLLAEVDEASCTPFRPAMAQKPKAPPPSRRASLEAQPCSPRAASAGLQLSPGSGVATAVAETFFPADESPARTSSALSTPDSNSALRTELRTSMPTAYNKKVSEDI